MTGNKKVLCKVCYKEMRSDVLTRHMKVHETSGGCGCHLNGPLMPTSLQNRLATWIRCKGDSGSSGYLDIFF